MRLIKRAIDIEKPGKTAEKILVAARAVFAEKGYSGTHVDEIAARAGVNKATLYYQIGDKDTLYANVIHHVLGNTAQNIAEAVAKVDSPEEKLISYINAIADAVDKNPEIPPIMMREIAAGGLTIPLVVAEDIVSIVTILIGVLEQGRKEKIFTQTNPFLIHMMIMGTVLFYKGSEPIKNRQTWLPLDLLEQDKIFEGSIGDEVAKLVLKAIKE